MCCPLFRVGNQHDECESGEGRGVVYSTTVHRPSNSDHTLYSTGNNNNILYSTVQSGIQNFSFRVCAKSRRETSNYPPLYYILEYLYCRATRRATRLFTGYCFIGYILKNRQCVLLLFLYIAQVFRSLQFNLVSPGDCAYVFETFTKIGLTQIT